MPNWNEVETQAKKLIDEGIRMLKTGANEAEVIAGKTASSAKLHVAMGQNRLENYRTVHDLGEIVFKALKKDATSSAIAVTPKMKELFTKIQKRETVAAEAEDKLKHYTIVRTDAPKKSKAAPKKTKPSGTKGSSAKRQ